MLVDVVANNVKDLLAKHQIRAADLIRMSEEAGLDVNKTFLSRLTNTKADSNQDFLLSKIDSLISVIRSIEPDLHDHHLFIPNYFRPIDKGMTSEQQVNPDNHITAIQLNDALREIIVDLKDMRWLDIKDDVPIHVVSDFTTAAIKKIFPNLVTDKAKQ